MPSATPRWVQKYGGTSVATLDRIRAVAERIVHARAQGRQLVVVLSAMAGETDRLIEMATELSGRPGSREYDRLLSTGEQVSVALLAIWLQHLGCPAYSLTGPQAGIETDANYSRARIININAELIESKLAQGMVVIVAGFQGVNNTQDITTLGRGGSDTTAVALAAALRANECQIYTDVDGVYTSDPRVVPDARLLSHITFEEMLEMASLGAKVLQIRAVEYASRCHVPLRVLSSFTASKGTLITEEESPMEHALISGIAFDRKQAKLTLKGLPNLASSPYEVLAAVSQAGIDVDMIVQNVPAQDQTIDMSFTVQRTDYKDVLSVLNEVCARLQGKGVVGDDKIAKLSVIGVGMRSHAGVATTLFRTLSQEGIQVQLVSTSEIKISVVIDEKYLELGARSLHAAFKLDQNLSLD